MEWRVTRLARYRVVRLSGGRSWRSLESRACDTRRAQFHVSTWPHHWTFFALATVYFRSHSFLHHAFVSVSETGLLLPSEPAGGSDPCCSRCVIELFVRKDSLLSRQPRLPSLQCARQDCPGNGLYSVWLHCARWLLLRHHLLLSMLTFGLLSRQGRSWWSCCTSSLLVPMLRPGADMQAEKQQLSRTPLRIFLFSTA